jgi:hypothetical protein
LLPPICLAENPLELGQATLRIIEEHQPELTDHGIKAVIGIGQCLTIKDFQPDR